MAHSAWEVVTVAIVVQFPSGVTCTIDRGKWICDDPEGTMGTILESYFQYNPPDSHPDIDANMAALVVDQFDAIELMNANEPEPYEEGTQE
jgi:hypothetical protein